MADTKFMRKGKRIMNIEGKETKTYDSINAAKRESRRIQLKEDGGLGRGSVVAYD